MSKPATRRRSVRGGHRLGAGRPYLGTEPRSVRLSHSVTPTTKRILEELARLNHKGSMYALLCEALDAYAADCAEGGLAGVASNLALRQKSKPRETLTNVA